VLTFTNAAEQAAWTMAEALSEKAFAAMRQQFKARGLSDVDASIRWKGTAQAQAAWADQEYYMTQASMYNEAATAQYAKALYLKSH
jgi:hypothetical protein